ncbi:hypothetical protein [Microbacterium sp. lyk4-40-TSB-66]|uniref:hypothetical protein n=1 Tax=Microbacterium sp. lyk4-40-TSB-66 TaxID=3040294 RepID=UPI00254C48F8|nr:hypothetical protein [Microbacterium sp. lyk4-40-TSB-66]
MTELPPPTRRGRKDLLASGVEAPAGARAGDPAAEVPAAASGTRRMATSGGSAPAPVSAASGTVVSGTAVSGTAVSGTAVSGTAVSGVAGAGEAASSTAIPPFEDDPERLPTAQLEMAAFGDHLIPYVPPVPPTPPSLAPWALALAILALSGSLFTGWLLPLGVTAVVFAALSLRRAHDGRRAAVWALCLAVLSLVFSVGWLVWGFSQLAVV